MYTVIAYKTPEVRTEENKLRCKPSSSGMSHCFSPLCFLTALVCKVEKIKEICRLNQKPGGRAARINANVANVANPTLFTMQRIKQT